MAFLSLKDIGKIYVSDNNVSVGIRGINLDFEKGEFVAVTGKSGSGKSTLLNVISGMDTYEEGELFIEGDTTSHYLQSDWEDYRSKYISFIFQDYNIIESFTVLQNVELALMHIEDKKERRRRALDLIERVGMSSHLKHKGSKLSGGQKQRTVIARALAKDSPIILADEPTGNLDSATSVEIIELLREVSKDKLLIVVTHNYEEVERYATRHVRFFDGFVESDTVISKPESTEYSSEEKDIKVFTERKRKIKKEFKDGLTLGKAIFFSKPKLSVFLCFLMIIGTLGIFMVTSFCGSAKDLFRKYPMFNDIEGRLVVVKRSGEVITEEELEKLSKEHGAKSYLHYDILLDSDSIFLNSYYRMYYDGFPGNTYMDLDYTFGENFGNDIIGRYPSSPNEVFLYLPISKSKDFGSEEIEIKEIYVDSMEFDVVGIKYYYDNNLKGKCLFTEEGFNTATSIYYLMKGDVDMSVTVEYSEAVDGKLNNTVNLGGFIPSYDVEEGKIYIGMMNDDFLEMAGKYTATVSIESRYFEYDYFFDKTKEYRFSKEFTEEYISTDKKSLNNKGVYIHPSLLKQVSDEVLSKSYKQASLFFESDKAAEKVAEKLNMGEYLAVPSNTTYKPDIYTIMSMLISVIFIALFWVLAIVFFAFFINLCSSRILSAFKSDMAIMRSMGISVNVIKKGMYTRMFIALIPAFMSVVVGAIFIFTSPTLNEFFTYLYADQYLIIFLGMIMLTYRTTKKQVKKLFGQSVKKSLKGGDAE